MKPRRHHSPHAVLRAVCRASGVSLSDLVFGVRLPRTVRARQAAVYLLRHHTLLSFPEIAEEIGRGKTGRRSHSTQVDRYWAADRLVKWGNVEFINLLDAACEALGEVKETADD